MSSVGINLYVASMAAMFFLLAAQAEPITAFLGYSYGVVLALALIVHTVRESKGGPDA